MWTNGVSLKGFKMTCMAEDAYGDALIEHLKPEAVISNLCIIKVRFPLATTQPLCNVIPHTRRTYQSSVSHPVNLISLSLSLSSPAEMV
jgi:hypothetical protein